LADLVLELRDALAARREVERGLALALAQILDIGDEIRGDRLDAAFEIRGLVRGRGDLNQRLLVGEGHVLELPALGAPRADPLSEMTGVTPFAIRLLREAARHVRVVAVLVELSLGLREQLARAREGLRRVAADACLLGLREQRARLAQVLRFDRSELGVAIECLGFLGATARAA